MVEMSANAGPKLTKLRIRLKITYFYTHFNAIILLIIFVTMYDFHCVIVINKN